MNSLIFVVNVNVLLVLGIMQIIACVALLYMIVANRSTTNAIVFAIVFPVILFVATYIYYLLWIDR